MADLSKEDIQALGRAVGLDIQEPELTEVMYSLNALLESLGRHQSSRSRRGGAAAHHPAPGLSARRSLTPATILEGNDGQV